MWALYSSQGRKDGQWNKSPSVLSWSLGREFFQGAGDRERQEG